MENTSRYGRVRKARVGEIPTHLAMETIREGEALIVHMSNAMRDNMELSHHPMFMRPGAGKAHTVVVQIEESMEMGFAHIIGDEWLVQELARKRAERRRMRRVKWGRVFGLLLVVVVIAVLAWAAIARAETITYVADNHIPDAGKMVSAEVTAYTSSVDETDDRPWETAAGTVARDGVIACPSEYAFGTEVVIAGKTYVCEDRMNARYREDAHFDVWVADKETAFEFGRQQMTVTVK